MDIKQVPTFPKLAKMKNYKLTSKNLTDIPFHYLTSPETSHLLLGIEQRAAELIPQALVYLHKNVTLVRNSDNKINPKSINTTLNPKSSNTTLINPMLSLAKTAEALGSEEFNWLGGLIEYLTRADRSSIIGKLVQKRNPNFSALVPLVLSAFKIYRKIGYEEWDFSVPQMSLLVDPKLYEAMNTNVDWVYSNLTKEHLIEFRDASRMVKSGASMGKIKDLTDIYRINNVGIPEFDAYPPLVRTILCQTWLAHPRIRCNLMVLELPTFDAMPEPLQQEEIVEEKYVVKEDKPWGNYNTTEVIVLPRGYKLQTDIPWK